MNINLKPKGLKAIDEEIERLSNQLKSINPVDDDYIVVAERLKILCEAREKKNSSDISSEAILSAAVSLIGLLVVLNFEKTGVITSKAFTLIGWKK